MARVYIGAIALIAIIIIGFALMHWHQNQEIAQAYSTPSPAPSSVATQKPIQLIDGQALGAARFGGKYIPDYPKGGLNAPVDGIPCANQEYVTLHVHSHLALFFHGKQIQVPKSIGIVPTISGGCLYWLHTHDASGILHIESPQLNAPKGGGFTLGEFFDIWGKPLTNGNVAGMTGKVTAYVNGLLYQGDLHAIPLGSHQQIVLEIGTPTVPPPNYIFPPND